MLVLDRTFHITYETGWLGNEQVLKFDIFGQQVYVQLYTILYSWEWTSRPKYIEFQLTQFFFFFLWNVTKWSHMLVRNRRKSLSSTPADDFLEVKVGTLKLISTTPWHWLESKSKSKLYNHWTYIADSLAGNRIISRP